MTYLYLYSFPTRRASDISQLKSYWYVLRTSTIKSVRFKNYANSIRHTGVGLKLDRNDRLELVLNLLESIEPEAPVGKGDIRSEEHTSELQSRGHLVCRL